MIPGLHRTFVGNDIVDLTDPRVDRAASQERFLDRIFTPPERAWADAADRRTRALWTLWAGKEAGFKAVSKALGHPPVFVHDRFEVQLEDFCSGTVRYDDWVMMLRVEHFEDAVHALAWAGVAQTEALAFTEWGRELVEWTPGERTGVSPEAAAHLTPGELSTIHHDGSAWCRVHARRALAQELRVEEKSIRILGDPESPGRAPARLIVEGTVQPPDLSLSHHGHSVAWAFLRTDRLSAARAGS